MMISVQIVVEKRKREQLVGGLDSRSRMTTTSLRSWSLLTTLGPVVLMWFLVDKTREILRPLLFLISSLHVGKCELLSQTQALGQSMVGDACGLLKPRDPSTF